MPIGPHPAPLTGLAVGDALGMPFETEPRFSKRIASWTGDFRESTYHKLKPGQWTDDTKMARLLAESLLKNKDFDPADIARRYRAWYRSGDLRGMGKATKQALQRLEDGCPWVHSGVLGAEGNAPAMRAAPIGFYFRYNPKDAMEVARREARITHDSDVAAEGAAIVALGVALITNGTYHSLDQDLGRIMVGRLYPDKPSNLGYSLTLAIVRAMQKRMYKEPALDGMPGSNAHTIQTIPAAFYAFSASRNYREAVELAVRAGGDTDTTAAIAGALAGSFYGIDQVQRYLPQLEDAEALRTLESHLYMEAPRPRGH